MSHDETGMFLKQELWYLTHSTALSPAFQGGEKKRRSGSTLSKPRHLCRGVEGLTYDSINRRE